ncbi:MAG: tRNA 4-thiouridine(8) synthase ThiI, partial [Oscillospiraceae bacterium]|nr:tRNA 4-thiouridine(8) synthase ThiI [Oscillospiraceae bacterium]
MVLKEIILLKDGEIALKGLNRSTFEDRLIRNAKQVLNGLGTFKFVKSQSTIVVRPDDTVDVDEAFERLKKLFGVISLTRACVAPKDFNEICEYAKEYLADVMPEYDTFKVNAKRSDK